jgi:DNA-binding transcriptional regulator YiaG
LSTSCNAAPLRVRLMSKAVSLTESQFYASLVRQLRTRRETLGYTQLDLALKIGVSDYMVSKWECLLKMPTSFGLMCWCHALEVDLVVRVDE